MKHHNTGKDLFKLIINYNEAAFSELFLRYHTRIYPFEFKMIKSASTAEDLTAGLFSTIWQHRKKLLFVDMPEEYIYKIACIAKIKQLKISLIIWLPGTSNKIQMQAAYIN